MRGLDDVPHHQPQHICVTVRLAELLEHRTVTVDESNLELQLATTTTHEIKFLRLSITCTHTNTQTQSLEILQAFLLQFLPPLCHGPCEAFLGRAEIWSPLTHSCMHPSAQWDRQGQAEHGVGGLILDKHGMTFEMLGELDVVFPTLAWCNKRFSLTTAACR